MKELLRVNLDVEPFTWGGNDAERREKLREAIKDKIPDFSPSYIEHLLGGYEDIEVVLNCHFDSSKKGKDIDNLAKIPVDAVFYSAQGEDGYQDWERKVTLLTVRKLQSSQSMLEVIVYGTPVS